MCETFGLGVATAAPVVAAAGWGGRNRVWRVETDRGVFAVKDTTAELLPEQPDAAFTIELVAHAARVLCPSPILSIYGAVFEEVGGRWYRCHEWVEGSAKQNEDTTPEDARGMGRVVAQLHLLGIDAGPGPAPVPFERSHWLDLAARSPTSAWSPLVRNNLDAIVAADAMGASFRDDALVGSHCDLNAHNVLFTDRGPVLIDWDAAGPASPAYERASTTMLWAQRADGRYSLEIAAAFLRSYRDRGGHVSLDDVGSLRGWLIGLAWWTERNLQIAVAQPSRQHDQLATQLTQALIRGAATIETRQHFLQEVLEHL
ncbi:MAG: phosphotransferase [Ilumatobacteraceae bacterium]